jgi:ATP synthase protein I
LSNQSPEPPLVRQEGITPESSSSSEQDNSMTEYYQLQKTLLLLTLVLTGIMFGPIWYFYSLNIALNFLLGALGSVVYLRFLAKDVEKLSQEQQRVSSKGLGFFIILMIVAIKWQQLHILPVFLGFLTYKVAIIFYMLQTLFVSTRNKPSA